MAGAVFSPAYRALTTALVAARRGAGLTQVELAQRLGKPQSFVSKYERSERRVDVVEFCLIADAVGVRPETLIGEYLAQINT